MLFFWLFNILMHSNHIAYGTTCSGNASVEQIHLSLVDELNVCVMWNSTYYMEKPTVQYSKGECISNLKWMYAYGTQTQYPSGGFIHLVNLEDLESGSTYCYVIQDLIGDTCGHSTRNQFRTPSPKKAMFAVLSDSGTFGNVSYIMKNLATDDDVTLVLHPGDLSYGLTEDVWNNFGKIVEPVAREKPYMIIPGNWDVKNSIAIQAFVNRYTMPLAAQPRQRAVLPLSYYYSFNYSVFHIVMLSSYDPYNETSPQYNWLLQDLQTADEDREKHPWIIVSFHSPMYSSNSGHGGGDLAFRLAVEPILAKYAVDVVLTGHDHGYERTYPVINNIVLDSTTSVYYSPNAPIHILVGTGGATLDSWMAAVPAWSAHREASFGYTTLQAEPHHLHVKYVRQDRTIGDQFQISKGGGGGRARAAPMNQLRMVFGAGLVMLFAVLPLLLYKGLPDSLRNYLLCRDDDDDGGGGGSDGSDGNGVGAGVT